MATKQRGGARPGAGRPVNRIRLDEETASLLRILVRAQPGELDAHELVARLIHDAWQAREAELERFAQLWRDRDTGRL